MTPRQRFIGWVILIGLVVGSLAYLFDGVTDRLTVAEQRADRGEAALAQTGEALDEANGRVAALDQQVRDLGEDPVVPTQPLTGPTIVQGQRGEQGLRGLVGLPGAPGAPGRPGRDSTVPGPTGAAGRDGADSTVPGPAGPAGRDGSDGTDGRDGADGRGVSDVQCSDGRWIVTYTDGTSSDAGDCQPSLIEVPAS